MSKLLRIKRSYNENSLQHGKVEYVDEAKAREVFNNVLTYDITSHPYGDLEGRRIAAHNSDEPMKALKRGAKVGTFFSDFEIEEADREPFIKAVDNVHQMASHQ